MIEIMRPRVTGSCISAEHICISCCSSPSAVRPIPKICSAQLPQFIMSKSTEKSSHNQSCKGSDGASPCKTQPHITGDRQSQATATEIRSDRPEQRQAIDCSSFEVFSCWRYENEVEITCIQDRLLSTNLATWMQSSTTNRQGKQSISGLRIVIGRQLSGEIFPFTKQQMQALTRSPSLAERLHEVSSRAASLNVKLASEEADTGNIPSNSGAPRLIRYNLALVFKFEKSVHEIRCLLTLRDCQSKITTVFIAALDPAEVTELWTTLHTKSKYYDHPLLLAIEICELQVEDLCAQLRRVQEQILAFDAFEEESRKSSGMYFKNIGDAAFERALDGIHSAKRDLERAEDCRASSSGLVAFLKEQCSERTGSDCYLQERLSTLSSTLDLLPAFKVLKWKLQSRHPFVSSEF